jgi:hypothetical protein
MVARLGRFRTLAFVMKWLAFISVFALPVLRKLHLVRPDLIPFPLPYEVYC